MEFKNWLSLNEMPIRTWRQEGDWSPDARRQYGWDRQDAALLSNPAAVEKFQRLWARTEHDYHFYLVRDRFGNKHREIGEVDQEWVWSNISDQIFTDYDAISIIFTNNRGSEKVPFTAWTAAHRFGHAIQRSRNITQWQEFTREVQRDMESVLRTVYGQKPGRAFYDSSTPDRSTEGLLRRVAQQVGTMRSARQENLRNWFEFNYELLAQYLLTTNKVKFRLPAGMLITRYVFGHPQGFWNRLRSDEDREGMQELLNSMADEYNETLGYVLEQCVGRLFVM